MNKDTSYKSLTEVELGLVLGCKAIILQNGVISSKPITLNSTSLRNLEMQNDYNREKNHPIVHALIPLLRPLTTLTEEEKDEFRAHKFEQYTTENLFNQIQSGRLLNWHHSVRSSEITRWLLAKHLDVFKWIPQRKALDATKYNEQTSTYEG